MKNRFRGAIVGTATVLALGMGAPALASSTFDFDGAGTESTPTGTAGTDFYNDSGSPQLCTTGDFCSVTDAGGLSFLESGISLNVTGAQDFVSATDYAGASVLEDLRGSGAGLGVTSESATNSWGFNSSLEQVNFNQEEALVFNFGSQSVSFDSIILNQGAHGACTAECGTFDFWVDGSLFGSLTGLSGVSQSFTDVVGSVFIFALASDSITGYGHLREDGIYVGGLTVSAVPLPATALLMFSALGGAGLARRRRQRKISAV